MTGMIVFLALLFGFIAIWAGISMMGGSGKSPPRQRPRAASPAAAPTDPWGARQMRRGERNSLQPGQHKF